MWGKLSSNLKEILLDSLIDSAKVFAVVLIINIIISFFENKLANSLNKKRKIAPLYGSICGLIPQCGISVVASDLYLKKHITVGTLIAVFIACNDEAIPIMLASGNANALMILPLIAVKLVVGFISGFIIDLILSKKKQEVHSHISHCDNKDKITHIGCCNHEIDGKKESKVHKHLTHPLLHSIKLFLYVFIINLFFGCIITIISEAVLMSFLQTNKYITPLICILIGLIPNCASSVIIAQMFVVGGLSFGATLAGLCVNAGLGLVFLFKSKNGIKNNLTILSTIIGISIFVGYATCLIIGF